MNAKATPLFLALLLLSASAALSGDNLGDYLPHDKVEGHFMRVTLPPRANELAEKMMAAIGKNKGWLLDAIKKSSPGEPLPYDERLGLTEAEYKEFLALSKQMTLKEIAVHEIHVVRNSDNTISLVVGKDEMPTLSALKFDLAKNTVSTPFGELANPKPVDLSAKGEGGALGPYKGLSFHLETVPGDLNGTAKWSDFSGKTVSMILGKMADGTKRFIYYEASAANNGQLTQKSIQMVLEY